MRVSSAPTALKPKWVVFGEEFVAFSAAPGAPTLLPEADKRWGNMPFSSSSLEPRPTNRRRVQSRANRTLCAALLRP